jgi:hypothetical protein
VNIYRITRSRIFINFNIKLGERGHTPSRGAPCQYLVGRGPTREAEMCPTARERSRRVAVEEADAVLKGSQSSINYQNKSRTNPRAAVIPS